MRLLLLLVLLYNIPMNSLVQSAGEVYDHTFKGHDRLYLSDDRGFYGVFDGAGGQELSDAIVHALPAVLEARAHLRQTNQTAFMAAVAADLDNLPEKSRRRSTGAMACVDPQGDDLLLSYVNFGDSSLYFLDESGDTLRLLAHTPTEFLMHKGRRGSVIVDKFLGAGRSPKKIAPLVGSLVLPKSTGWSVIGITDGIQDDDDSGVSTNLLEDIVRTNPCSDIPSTVMANTDKYDDAALFIVQRKL